MKKILFMAFMAIITFVCSSTIQAQTNGKATNYVDVLYFHGKQRCPTCKAVGQFSREVVDVDLAKLTKANRLNFKEVDFSTPEGEKIADKYKVSFSGLVLRQVKNGKEKTEDITRFAFQNARTDTPKFKKELAGKINNLLK